MQRWRGLDAVPGGWGRSVVTIGVFDGVHKGHQATIGYAVKRASDLGVASVVLTFDPHPSEVVRPGSHPPVLTEPGRKAALIEQLGVDVLCVVPFTPDFSRLSADAFVHDVLVERLHAALIVVGENFRFGHKAAGDVALLRRLGRTFGFGVEAAPLVPVDTALPTVAAGREPASNIGTDAAGNGSVVSSTYIRACIGAGDVTAAAAVLGRPHRLEGVVVRGDQRGRELGFPTANVLCHRHAAVPADGVYAARLVRLGRTGSADAPQQPGLPAAVSIGTNPTFAGRERRVEAYVLDFEGDLYGERVALDFVAHLRQMRRYDAVEPLVAQIAEDVAQTRQLLG